MYCNTSDHFQRKAEEKVDTIHNFLSNELLAKDSLIKAQLYELSETKKKLTLERTLQTTLLADSHDIIQQSLKKQSLECGLENFGKTEENICFLGSDEVELGIRLESLNGKIEDIQKIEGGVYDELLSKVLECRVEDVEGIVKNVEPVL